MVEILARRRKEIIPEARQQRDAQDREQDQRRQEGIGQDLKRVLVKRRQDLDPRGGMMDLVKHMPESVPVPQPVPPVKHKGAYTPANKALQDWHIPAG